MKSFAITLISDNIKLIDITNCPLIFEVVSSEMFQYGFYNKQNYIIIDGFALAVKIFQKKVDFLNKKIDENVFWFYSLNELETENTFYFEIKNFIYDNILAPIKHVETIIVYNKSQLTKINPNVFLIKNELNNYFLYDGNKLYLIDLNYFEFITEKEINHLHDFIGNINIITFRNIKLNLKKQGLVDKNFSFNNFYEYFKQYDYCSNDLNEFYKWLTVYFFNIQDYISIDKKEEILINSKKLNLISSSKYNNFYENIMFIEEYLSDIQIKNIDFNKFSDLEFIVNHNAVQYSYNGSDTITGRMYPINLNGSQSLQTLNNTQKTILSAEKKCVLIEYDYKSFEFDILCQLAGINNFIDLDPHLEIIKYLFPKEIINDDLNNYRNLGKTINYSFIYGMNIDKVIEIIIDDLISDGDKKELLESDKDILDELKIFLKNKLESYEIIAAMKSFTKNISEYNFNENSCLLRNYFGRFIRVGKKHALLNNFISSTAADFLYLKMRMIIDLLLEEKINLEKNKIILQNHDSILLQLENDIINNTDIFERIDNIMNADINDLTGRVNYIYGVNWGLLK